MKKLRCFALIMAVLFFAACGKDSDSPQYAVEGLWQGNIGTGNGVPNGYFALFLRNNGTLEQKNVSGKTLARGDFSLVDTVMSGKYIYDDDGALVTFTAVMNNESNRLTGKWENESGTKGTWILTKE